MKTFLIKVRESVESQKNFGRKGFHKKELEAVEREYDKILKGGLPEIPVLPLSQKNEDV